MNIFSTPCLGSFIDFSSLEPPPPPPEEDIDEAKEKEDEPVYHGENIRIMVMSSEVVQLGKLHIVTEIGKISFLEFKGSNL